MAKILFCLNSVVDIDDHAIDSFYQGFIDSLMRNGNDVYLFRTNNFLTYSHLEQELVPSIDKPKLDDYLKAIEPDIIFTFNNNLYRTVLENTECPVVFFASESYDFLQSVELLKKYESRYYYVYFSEDSRAQMLENMGIDKNKAFVTYVSTDVKNNKIAYEQNISFIGCIHYLPTQIMQQYNDRIKDPETRELLLSVLGYISKDPLSTNVPDLEALQDSIADPNIKVTLMNLLSRHFRLEVLSSVADLGLHTYGKDFLSAFTSFPNVALSFKGPASTLSQISHIYNSSKISLNIPHIHSIAGFTWRVPEIMASNSILVSRSGLNKMFGAKFKLPSFENPYEARQLCQKLLAEENLRSDLVQYSNEIIDKLCRFEQRLEELEKLLSVTLLNDHNKGKLFYIDIKDYSKHSWLLFERLTLAIINKLPNKAVLGLGQLARPIRNWIPKNVKKAYTNIDKG